jgi:hypothetical protein
LSTDAFEGVLESPVSRHRYLYGNDNPLTYADPSGNFASMAEATETLVLASIIAGLGIISFSSTLTKFKNNRSIEWDGKLSYGFSVDSKTLSPDGMSIPGISTLFLNAESEERDFGELGLGQYKNTWFIATASADFGFPTVKPPVKFDPSEKKLNRLISPGIFGANMWTFFGEFITGQFQVPGGTNGSGFIAGVGTGWYGSESKTPDFDLGLKAGISIPTGKGKIE